MLFSVQDTWSHSFQAFAHALPSQEATPGCPCEVPSLCSYLISIFLLWHWLLSTCLPHEPYEGNGFCSLLFPQHLGHRSSKWSSISTPSARAVSTPRPLCRV